MEDFINWISQFLADALQWFFDLIKTVFLVLWDMLVDLFCFIVEMVFTALNALLALVPVPSNWSPQTYVNSLPVEVLQMMSAVGLTQAVGIIVVAIGIRFLLQLIPFVRLGS